MVPGAQPSGGDINLSGEAGYGYVASPPGERLRVIRGSLVASTMRARGILPRAHWIIHSSAPAVAALLPSQTSRDLMGISG
jgi:hypothetical protein